MKKNVRLTLKTAKALIKKEFGLSGSTLKAERTGDGVYIYKMALGRFEVTVENDWFDRNGLFVIEVSSRSGAGMRLYYDPITLEEDYEAGEKHRAETRKEYCDGCAYMQTAQGAR